MRPPCRMIISNTYMSNYEGAGIAIIPEGNVNHRCESLDFVIVPEEFS